MPTRLRGRRHRVATTGTIARRTVARRWCPGPAIVAGRPHPSTCGHEAEAGIGVSPSGPPPLHTRQWRLAARPGHGPRPAASISE